MSDLREIIQRHSIKHYRKLQSICEPLSRCLDIPFFSFYRINAQGDLAALTNFPEPLDYYYRQEKYLINPYLAHPQLFRSGFTIAPIDFDAASLSVFQHQFKIDSFFMILQRKEEEVEAFLFADQNPYPLSSLDFLPKIDVLQKFASYFRREARGLINAVMADHFNLKEVREESFFVADPSIPLLRKDPKISHFLKAIAPLSPQEYRCLELFKQGYSSQATASILGLSHRTVEFYFENIKHKLHCSSKWDLLQW